MGCDVFPSYSHFVYNQPWFNATMSLEESWFYPFASSKPLCCNSNPVNLNDFATIFDRIQTQSTWMQCPNAFTTENPKIFRSKISRHLIYRHLFLSFVKSAYCFLLSIFDEVYAILFYAYMFLHTKLNV